MLLIYWNNVQGIAMRSRVFVSSTFALNYIGFYANSKVIFCCSISYAFGTAFIKFQLLGLMF